MEVHFTPLQIFQKQCLLLIDIMVTFPAEVMTILYIYKYD